MGILQARILEWVALLSSRGPSQPRDWTQDSCIAGGFFTVWVTRNSRTLNSRTLKWVAYPFSMGSSRPRNRTGVSCIAGGFFTIWVSIHKSVIWVKAYGSNNPCHKLSTVPGKQKAVHKCWLLLLSAVDEGLCYRHNNVQFQRLTLSHRHGYHCRCWIPGFPVAPAVRGKWKRSCSVVSESL